MDRMKDMLVEQAVAWQMSYRRTGLLRTICIIEYFFGGGCTSERLCYFYNLMASLDNINLKTKLRPTSAAEAANKWSVQL
jgi:hypothetical protein